MKKIVVLGGGTGLSSMLAGMKKIQDAQVTAIVTVADDGGSTGRIRNAYNVPAMGDIRHVLTAMAQNDNAGILQQLMNYRFEGQEDVGGHSLGNLIFLAMMDITGSFMGAIESLSRVMGVNGTILPCTLDVATLYALMADGTLVRGEKNIPTRDNAIEHVYYQQDVQPYDKALEALREADLIIYGIGSLYTSVIPNLIIPGIPEAIYENPCPKIYFCNAMTQPGETEGYTMEDHVRALEKHSFKNPADLVVLNDTEVSSHVRERYARMGSFPVHSDETAQSYEVWKRPLITLADNERIRHDPEAVRQVVQEILEELG
ncbi:gluconeogenesis factor YvcK family protein [Faecalibaculum rodentium]|jgi:uncharacterized cofD-like protein|uniref:gluconeogenesis factor YvcK family protein n=1 Tax=Faecalibaculum rodentium TaxID=1702221 RepID=UPI00256F4F98|nr:gluconeogenesis factor YvcK family protein [Faecalibaculum rodentium]